MPEPLYYTLPEFDIKISFEPVDFVQVNRDINERMVHLRRAAACRSVSRTACSTCIAVSAISHCRWRGRRAGCWASRAMRASWRAPLTTRGRTALANAEFRVADLSKLDGREGWIHEGWDRLLLDPARSGAAEIVALMHVLGPQRIVYVSCHPGTLARDAGMLVHEKGYQLESAGIIDMFPHTAHVESIAVFTKL